MDAVEALEDKEMDLSELPLSSIMKSALCKLAWLPIKQGFQEWSKFEIITC